MKYSVVPRAAIISVSVVAISLAFFLWNMGDGVTHDPLPSIGRFAPERMLLAQGEKWEVLSAVFSTQMAHTFGEKETFEYARTDPVIAGDGYRVRCAGYTEAHDGAFFSFSFKPLCHCAPSLSFTKVARSLTHKTAHRHRYTFLRGPTQECHLLRNKLLRTP